METCLQFQRVRTWLSWWRAWWQGGKHHAGAVAESSYPDRQVAGRDRGLPWTFETSKPTACDKPPLPRLYFLIPPKHFYQLEIKYSKIWVYWGYNHSNHHSKENAKQNKQRNKKTLKKSQVFLGGIRDVTVLWNLEHSFLLQKNMSLLNQHLFLRKESTLSR